MIKRVLGFMLVGLLLLAACGGQETVSFPTATPARSDHRALIRQAESAYREGDFAEAFSAAQAAVLAAPQDATAWEWVRRSAVAQAADAYLEGLPADRYRITPEEFEASRVNGTPYTLIDVREPDEFSAGHIEGAVNIPLRTLTQHLAALPANTSAPIVVYCHSGRRAVHALVVLRELGYRQAYNLKGGYEAYQAYRSTHAEPTPGPTPTFDPARDPDQDGGC